jgi:adenine C2-methylase RlmN of 23S rRNA A2503 and tRNA A37
MLLRENSMKNLVRVMEKLTLKYNLIEINDRNGKLFSKRYIFEEDLQKIN